MGLLKQLNGYIYIMDGQKNFVRNLRSIFRCQKKGCIAFNFKGMYRPIMRGEKEIKELEEKEIWKELSLEYDKLKIG